MTTGPPLRERIAEWAAVDTDPSKTPAKLDGIDGEQHEILEGLKDSGILHLSGVGAPTEDGPMPEDPLRPRKPQAKLLSSMLAAAAEHRFQRLWNAAGYPDRARLLSASGPTAGTSLVAKLSLRGTAFCDWQWSQALRWRIGNMQCTPVTICRNMKLNGEECRERTCPSGDHAVECPCGPLRTRRHDDLADVYADIFDEIGGIARREIFVPELSGTEEAWLDVWGYGVPELPDALLDVSVRHPRAGRYITAAAQHPGAAAAAGSRENRDKYPSRAGRCIWPVIHETWDRLGEDAEQLLQLCAAAGRRYSHRRGRACGQELASWRARLDGTLQRAVCMQHASCMRGLPGRKQYRPRPLDLAALEAGTPV